MKIAILANRKDSFVRPLAEGLARMCARCDAVPEIHYDGLVGEIHAARDSFDPATRLRTFTEAHPQFYRGKGAALATFSRRSSQARSTAAFTVRTRQSAGRGAASKRT